jgi:ubiquinone/menaquinone biosynthesis C-methylase UbiE
MTVGMVEEFTRRTVVGWVSVPTGAPPTLVSLHIGNFQVVRTYATPGPAVSGIHVGGDGSVELPRPRSDSAAKPGGRSRMIKGPPGDRRNSTEEIRTFSFRIADIWPYVRRRHRVTVRVDDCPLPIYRHGMFLRSRRDGDLGLRELKQKFDEGYVLSQMGRIQLSKRLDTAWQKRSMELYTRVRKVLIEEHGYDAFLMYGTLLGAVREGGYIGHDADFDAGYVSSRRNGPAAAAELVEIAMTMIRHGFGADLRARLLHVHHPEDDDFHIDLFHTYFEDGAHRFPFGIAGTTPLLESDWTGTHDIDFPGGRAAVPNNAEQLVEHLYGDEWRRPKPGFNWRLDRTDHAEEAQLTEEQRAKVYWASFYARTEYTSGSSFFELVNARSDMPETVIDIGCGDGRDSCAFGRAGRTVLGLDQSPVGIRRAVEHAERNGVGDRVRFRECDVADVEQLGRLIDEAVEPAAGPVMFYLRFFLHAVPEDVQEQLLTAIRAHSRPGDLFAAEFRTDQDALRVKVHGKHYRRFQNAAEFRQSLTERFGFEVLHEREGTGLSPYGDEDPVLFRVVARRQA